MHNSSILTCIRHHESDRTVWPYDRGYGAQNPTSTASGAYQFLDSTWHTVSAATGHPGYARAKNAPPDIQDDVAWQTYHRSDLGGPGNWRGSGC